MKKICLLALLFKFSFGYSQAGAPAAYYNGFNFNQSGMALKDALATKITTTHTHPLTYQQAEDAIKVIDQDPNDTENVFLIYGFSSTICPSDVTGHNEHRKRNKNDDGTGACQWNREHTFAKSLGSPDLGTDGPGSDAHHLRAADVDRNSDRGSRKFAQGSGNSGLVGVYWYPGDEWKGDIARMMMYMYLRYGSQCLPKYVGVGNLLATDTNMIDLFLKWNSEDPVTEEEDKRNTYLGNASNSYGQGNRNPFIDNPYLATVIWGGPAAENRWPGVFLATPDFDLSAAVSIYPNPSQNHQITILSDAAIDNIQLITINGQVMLNLQKPTETDHAYTLGNLPSGFYFVKITSNLQTATKKIVVN